MEIEYCSFVTQTQTSQTHELVKENVVCAFFSRGRNLSMILEYLDAKTRARLMIALSKCKNLKSVFEILPIALAQQIFLPAQIDYFTHLTSEKTWVHRRAQRLAATEKESAHCSEYKALLENMRDIKTRVFASLAERNWQGDMIKNFLHTHSMSLTQAPLPMLKLRRETEARFITTWVESLLYDIQREVPVRSFRWDYFEDNMDMPINPRDAIRHFAEEVKNEANQLTEQMQLMINEANQGNKTRLVALLKFHNGQLDNCEEEKMLPNCLQILNQVYKSLCVLSKFFLTHIQEPQFFQDNALALLSEYGVCWNAYAAAMHELESQYRDAVSTYNDAFKKTVGAQILEPNNVLPLYSIAVVGLKAWSRLFTDSAVSKSVTDALDKVYFVRRVQNALYQLGGVHVDAKTAKQYYMPAKHAYSDAKESQALKEAVQNLSARVGGSEHILAGVCSLNTDESKLFAENVYRIDQVLDDAFNALSDISTNQLNVHYCGHSAMRHEATFENVKRVLQEQNFRYVDFLNSIFGNNSVEFKLPEVVSADIAYMKRLAPKCVIASAQSVLYRFVLEVFEQRKSAGANQSEDEKVQSQNMQEKLCKVACKSNQDAEIEAEANYYRIPFDLSDEQKRVFWVSGKYDFSVASY